MFWLRNKKNNFQLHTLIWGPVSSGTIGLIFGLTLHLFSFFVSTTNEGFGNTAHMLSILATPLQDIFQGFSV